MPAKVAVPKPNNAKSVANHVVEAAYVHRESLKIYKSRDAEIKTLAEYHGDSKKRDLVDINNELRDVLWILIQNLVQSFEKDPNVIKCIRADPKTRNFASLTSTLPLLATLMPELTDDTAKTIISYVAAKKPQKITTLEFLDAFIKDRFVKMTTSGMAITVNNQDIVDFTRVLILEFLSALGADLALYGVYIGSRADYDTLVYLMHDYMRQSVMESLESLHELENKKRSEAALLRKQKGDLTKKPTVSAVQAEVEIIVESEIDKIVNAAAINNLP